MTLHPEQAVRIQVKNLIRMQKRMAEKFPSIWRLNTIFLLCLHNVTLSFLSCDALPLCNSYNMFMLLFYIFYSMGLRGKIRVEFLCTSTQNTKNLAPLFHYQNFQIARI